MQAGDFAHIIRRWKGRPALFEGLTPNQIASFCFDIASAPNVRRVNEVLHDYQRYFILKGSGHGRRVYPNWSRIYEEFPELAADEGPTPARGRPTAPQVPIDEDLQHAFEAERRAARELYSRSPILIRAGKTVPSTRSDPHPIIEFVYHTIDDQAPLQIPEGAPVILKWPPLSPVRGTFLTHEPDKKRLFVTVDTAFDPATRPNTGRLEPAFEEILRAVERSALDAVESRSPLAGVLLSRPLHSELLNAPGAPGNALDASQADAFRRLVSRSASFLWGPPGTGKTHTLGEVVAFLASQGRRVLAISTANVAIDQLALRSLQAAQRQGFGFASRPGALFRYGRPRDAEVLRQSMLFPDPEISAGLRRRLAEVRGELKRTDLMEEARAVLVREEHDLLQSLASLSKRYAAEALVVFATTVQAPVNSVFREIDPFDTLVVDEASMVPLAYLLANCLYARRALIISGDFRQLPPIALANNEAAARWLHQGPFEYHGLGPEQRSDHPELSMLLCQRRMHPGVSACVNSVYYSGRLQDGAPPGNLRGVAVEPLPGAPRVFLEVTEEDGSRVFRTASGSRLNPFSARVAARAAAAALFSDPTIEVAVICPYRAQVRAVMAALRPLDLSSEDRRRLHVGTVHTFQGSERDVVIWDLVESVSEKIGRLFREDQGDRLSNVAITRAKGKVILVGDPKAFQFAPGHEQVRGLKRILLTCFNGIERRRGPEVLDELGLWN